MFATKNRPSNDRATPTEIESHSLSDGGTQFVLPYRKLGELKQYAWTGVAVGVFTLLAMIGWMAPPIWSGVKSIVAGDWVFGLLSAGFGCMGFFGFSIAIYILAASIAVLRDQTRTVIDVVAGNFRVREEFLSLSWSRKCDFDEIENLELTSVSERETTPTLPAGINLALNARSDDEDDKPFPLAVGYPEETLSQLATLLRDQLHTQSITLASLQPSSTARIRNELKRVEILETISDDNPEPVERPKETKLELTRHEHGLQIDAPRPGVWNAMTGFGIVWLTFIGIIAACLAFGEELGDAWLIALLIGVLFTCIGAFLVVTGINAGLRKLSIVTAGARLLVVSESLFGKKRNEWSARQLHRICTGVAHRDDDGDVMATELQIRDNNGNKHGFLSELKEEEQLWVAWELNSVLNLQSTEDYAPVDVLRDHDGLAIPNPDSSLTIAREHGVTSIQTQPRGLREHASEFGVAAVLVPIGLGIAFAPIWIRMFDGFDDFGGSGAFITSLVGLSLALCGIGTMIFGWVWAKRTFHFEASPSALHIDRQGWLSQKSASWQHEELRSVAIGDSGWKVGERSVQNLVVAVRDGSQFQAMTDHSFADLSTVTVAINEAMALASPTADLPGVN